MAMFVVFMMMMMMMLAKNPTEAYQKLSSTTDMPAGFTLSGGERFGRSIASFGDLDGDGVPDLAVGASNDDDGGTDAGAVYVVLMNLNGTGKAFQKLSPMSGMPVGFTLGGGSWFGSSIASLGDLDGDGVPDLAVGANGDGNVGAVYVVLMNPDRTGKAFQKLSPASGMPVGFTLDGSDYFGSSVACLGDLDGDGVPDIAVGAHGDGDGATILKTGAVYIVLMNPEGTGKAFQKLSTTTGMPAGFTLDYHDNFGYSVASFGDLDDDGVSDIAVGAFRDDDGGTETGAVYVVLMNPDGTGKAFQKLSITTGMPVGFTLDDSDWFGSSIACLGDIDGDAVPDLAVGAVFDDDGGTDTGAVYIILMNLNGTGKAFQKLSTTTGFTLDDNDNFGISIASLGDLDGDGVPDLAVGAYADDDGGTNTGAVYVTQLDLTIVPTVQPTTSLQPTLLPTSHPTLPPTILPTLPPTISPSQAPTRYCGIGTYLNEASGACVLCPVGKYTNHYHAPFPTKCHNCVAGTVAKELGLDKCDICPQGKLSSPDRSFCADCKAGEYIKDAKACAECERGRYAPQPLTGACLLCSAGSFTNNATKATTCSPCNAGSFSLGKVAECLPCQPGEYSTSGSQACKECVPGYFSQAAASEACSPCAAGKVAHKSGLTACELCSKGKSQPSSGQTDCTACAAGRFQQNKGSSACTVCSAGFVMAAEGAVVCVACPSGQAQPAPGQPNCTACAAGSFTNLKGSASCSDCPGNTFSATMATECTLCLKNFFYTLEGECAECPAGTECTQDGSATQELLTLEPSFWRIAPMAAEVYSCELPKACKGGLLVSDSRRLDSNDGADGVDWSDGYCNEGYTGPLCSSCVRNGDLTYYFGIGAESGVTECLRCGDSLDSKMLLSIVTTPAVLIFIIVLFLVAVFALLSIFSGPSIKPSKRHQLLLDRFAEESDSMTVSSDGSRTFTKSQHHAPETVATLKHQTNKSSSAVANLTEVVSTLTEGQITTKSTTRVERSTFFLSLVRNGIKMQVQLKSIIAFLQISGNIGFNYTMTWPANFEQVMLAAKVVNLDFIPALGVSCLTTSFDYIDKLVTMTLVPLAVAALLLTAYLFVNCTGRRKARSTGLEAMYKLPDELISSFDEKEMATFRKVFYELDDGSGEVTYRKIVKVIKESSPNLADMDSEERAQEVIATAAGTSGNGGVTFADFITIMDKARNQRQISPLSELADKIEATVTKVAGQTLFYVFLALTFVVFVATSTVIFNYFKCRSFPEAEHGKESYLYKDYSVDCNSSRYKMFLWYAIAMILIYPVGIPLLYVSLLFNHREILRNSEAMFREASNGYPTTGHLLFLTSAYKPEYYYFEVLECVRRLFLASIIGIVAADSAASPVIGLGISLAFINVFTLLEPFNVKEANIFSLVLSNSLTLFFVAALMIKTDSVSDDKADQQMFGRILIVVLCAGPIVTLYLLIKQSATSLLGTLLRQGGKEDEVREEELKTLGFNRQMGQSGTPQGMVDKESEVTNLGELPSTEEAMALVWQRFREHVKSEGSFPATVYQALIDTAAENEKRGSQEEFSFDKFKFDEALVPLRLKGMTARIAAVLLIQATRKSARELMTVAELLKVLNEPKPEPFFSSGGELSLLEGARSPSRAPSHLLGNDEELPPAKLKLPETVQTPSGIRNSRLHLGPPLSKEQALTRAKSSTTRATSMGNRDLKSNRSKENASKRSDSSPMQALVPSRHLPKEAGATSLTRDSTPSRETDLSLSEVNGRNGRWTTDTVDFAEGKEVTSSDVCRVSSAATADQSCTMANVDLEAEPEEKYLHRQKKQALGVEML